MIALLTGEIMAKVAGMKGYEQNHYPRQGNGIIEFQAA